MSLETVLKVDNVDAVRMSDGRLFHAAGPATQNARLPRRRLVRGSTRSPRAAERRAARVEMVVTVMPDSVMSLAIRQDSKARHNSQSFLTCIALIDNVQLNYCYNQIGEIKLYILDEFSHYTY